ncbi:class I SAM-dependent methyltransferase [Prauserella oleivorans]|uniref:Class I SAM-dependent methyltransferase n=1 Tax=Prauserella oleivorans TaxID=1478153 RepID=A0ABW5WJI4_9PSEU
MDPFGWDHNAYYQRLLLRAVPMGARRVLDVGCGAGSMTARLARRATHVDAIDCSPEMIEFARERTPANVRCVLADVLEYPLPDAGYDAVVSMTALHHLPLETALTRLARAVRPGGVLAAVALPRTDLPRELPVELLGAVSHLTLGLGFAALRRLTGRDWYRAEDTHDRMPILDPSLTTAQVRSTAAAVLPGSEVRRLAHWRYLLRWRRPQLS